MAEAQTGDWGPTLFGVIKRHHEALRLELP